MAYRYLFERDKRLPPEQWKRPGKVDWPNMLDVVMSKRAALELIGDLARRLEITPGAEPIQLTWVGELTEHDDEDALDRVGE